VTETKSSYVFQDAQDVTWQMAEELHEELGVLMGKPKGRIFCFSILQNKVFEIYCNEDLKEFQDPIDLLTPKFFKCKFSIIWTPPVKPCGFDAKDNSSCLMFKPVSIATLGPWVSYKDDRVALTCFHSKELPKDDPIFHVALGEKLLSFNCIATFCDHLTDYAVLKCLSKESEPREWREFITRDRFEQLNGTKLTYVGPSSSWTFESAKFSSVINVEVGGMQCRGHIFAQETGTYRIKSGHSGGEVKLGNEVVGLVRGSTFKGDFTQPSWVIIVPIWEIVRKQNNITSLSSKMTTF